MLRFVSFKYLLLHLSLFSMAIAQTGEADYLKISYSYGSNQFLPSLVANSGLQFDHDELFSDLWIQGGFKISEKLSFAGGLELTDQPHQLIGTKFSRPDYPLSTGRFQQSVVTYRTEEFAMRVGRDDMLSSQFRPDIFQLPVAGDGFAWNYKWNSWSFKHVFQVLPAEKFEDQIFRRSVSYHHLSRKFNNFTVGAGEYFILSGNQIGFDLKRLNPFLPYSLNSHDSEANVYSGFSGDSDNSLIKFFLDWRKNSSEVALKLYVDEFQIDAVDREVLSDAMLLSFFARNTFNIFDQRSIIQWGFSASNPNFGQHPGPFTTTTIGAFPLFEYTPGMKNLYFFDAIFFADRKYQLSVAGYSEKWVNISQLAPYQMNLIAELDQLEVHSDSRLSLKASYRVEKYPLVLGMTGWVGSGSENTQGVKLEIQLNPGS